MDKFNRMVELHHAPLDTVFAALADPTRRAMLGRLADGDASVGELAAPHDMSLAAASKHIQVLERAGLIDRTVKGRTHSCRLNPEPLAEVTAWLRHYEKFWQARLDDLERALLEDANNDTERTRE